MAQISIIVPVYKVESYLHRCVDSILVQTFTDFELILVDDGSPDTCGRICDEYAQKDPRIHVIHQENGGLSAARNAGLDWVFASSDSEWISFVDSDDWIHPRMVESLYDAVRRRDVKVSICGFESTDGFVYHTEEGEFFSELWDTEELFVDRSVNVTVAWGKLYHRSCFQVIRYPVGKINEDEFVTYRILFELSKIAVIDERLYKYFHNDNGLVHSPFTIKKLHLFEALENQIEYFGKRRCVKAQRIVLYRYLSLIVDRLNSLKKDKKNQAEAIRALTMRKRRTFPKYIAMLSVENDQDAWILTKIMPVRMHIYWYYRALRNKIKKLFFH